MNGPLSLSEATYCNNQVGPLKRGKIFVGIMDFGGQLDFLLDVKHDDRNDQNGLTRTANKEMNVPSNQNRRHREIFIWLT